MIGYVLIKQIYLVGIVYCVRHSIFNTLFNKCILCPECMYSVGCWCEMIMHMYGLCYLPVLKVCG